MGNAGWIKLHRQLMENELYFTERFTRVQAWLDMLLLANHKPATLFLRGIEIKLNVGDLAYSMQSLSSRWRWNLRTVKKFLNWLENRQMVQCRNSNVTTVISILRYSDYQSDTSQSAVQNTSRVQCRMHTDNNVKNEKNKIFLSDSNEIRLSELLFGLIRQRNPGFKQPDLQKWASHVSKTVRIDNRLPEDIERVINWCQQDSFWQNNILSTEKLRKQFDALHLKMNADSVKNVPRRHSGVVL